MPLPLRRNSRVWGISMFFFVHELPCTLKMVVHAVLDIFSLGQAPFWPGLLACQGRRRLPAR